MIAYLNGQFLPLSEARISPMDRGFLYSDGVYEVIPVYSRFPFRIDEHLSRLQQSLDGIRLPNPHTDAEWRKIIRRLIAETEFDDQLLYIQVTRGADVKRDPCFPKGVPQTVFLFTSPLVGPSAAQREKGVAAITAPDIRWSRCDLKTVALLPNVLTRELAVDAGCAETILLRDGYQPGSGRWPLRPWSAAGAVPSWGPSQRQPGSAWCRTSAAGGTERSGRETVSSPAGTAGWQGALEPACSQPGCTAVLGGTCLP